MIERLFSIDGLKLAIACSAAYIGLGYLFTPNFFAIICGFILVGGSIGFVYYYVAKLRHPNRHQAEIDILSKHGADILNKQDKDQK